MNRAVFLDRDNTIIRNDGDLGDPAKVELIQGAASAIASLRGLGYRIVVVSNQAGVARGKFTEVDVEATNARVNELVKSTSATTIDRFYYCPYHPEATVEKYRGDHPWRKPNPGMLLQAAKDMGLDLSQCWLVGDQARDIQSGAAAGCRTVLLTPSASAQPPLRQEKAAAELFGQAAQPAQVLPDFVARNLIEAVRVIAQQRRPEGLEDLRRVEAAAKTVTPPAALASAALRMALTPSPIVPAKSVAPQPVVLTPPPPAPVKLVEAPAEIAASSPPAPRAQPASPPPVERAPAPPVPSSAHPPAEETLRHILQEMRNLRRVGTEFNYLNMLAIVFQMVAVVCLVAALTLGRSDAAAFLRWLGAGLMVQLATIALLLFRR